MRIVDVFGSLTKALARLFAVQGAVRLALSDYLVMTTDLIEFSKETRVMSSTQDISGSGDIAYFQVPEGQRWYLGDFSVSTTTGGKNFFFVYHNATQTYFYWYLGSSRTTYWDMDLSGVVLDEGDYIGCKGTSNVADTAIEGKLIYKWIQVYN